MESRLRGSATGESSFVVIKKRTVRQGTKQDANHRPLFRAMKLLAVSKKVDTSKFSITGLGAPGCTSGFSGVTLLRQAGGRPPPSATTR